MKRLLPDGILAQHLAALGKTGSGKSSVLRLLVEGLLDDGKPVCVVDPKGDWWGLKSSSNGKSPGYAVIIFGGEHADLPLNAHAGAHVAELVATGNRPCIIDLGGWMVSDRTRFFIDFASTLFRHVRGPRHLVIDEVHNFAPQGKVLDPDAGKMLHWANRLASEGRGKGITLMSASQRPQKVHKDFLTCAETLIAMRVIHPLDRNAVKDWIDGCPDPEKGREVLQSLASMPRGTGWVWSPEIGFGPVRVEFPKFSTYDSFKAPTSGADTAEKLKGWAAVDLEDARTKLSAVVEEAAKNDPRLLRARIHELEARVKEALADEPRDAAREEARTQDAYHRGQQDLGADVLARLQTAEMAVTALKELVAGLGVSAPRAQNAAAVIRKTIARSPLPTLRRSNGDASKASEIGNGGLRRIMTALAQRPQGLSRKQIGVRAGMSSSSGTFSTYLAKARSMGWVEGGPLMRITPAGIAALGHYEPLPTGRDLLEHWLRDLGDSGASRILRACAERYPRSISKADAAAHAELSETSGTFNTYLSKLRSLELISGRGELRASEELFE